MAVTGMFVAAAIKELRTIVFQPMMALVRQYTMVALSQQAGPFNMASKQHKLTGMDPYVLIDALADIMGHEEKELCKVRKCSLNKENKYLIVLFFVFTAWSTGYRNDP